MEFSLSTEPLWPKEIEGAILFVFEDGCPSPKVGEGLQTLVEQLSREGKFSGKEKEIYIADISEQGRVRKVILAGLGRRTEVKARGLAEVAGLAVKEAKRYRIGSLYAFVPEGDGLSMEASIRMIVEGFVLGLYRFSRFKTEKQGEGTVPEKVLFLVDRVDGRVVDSLRKGQVVGEEVNYVRDLVNTPGNVMTPARLGEEAGGIAKEFGMICRTFDRRGIEELEMEAFLSVARGSDEPPRFIILEYKGGEKREAPVILVGKAVTFDSGGISLKPSKDMDQMKYDMAGGGPYSV